MKNWIYIGLSFVFSTISNGQDVKTLDNAIQTALTNNHQILMSGLQNEISENSTNPGQAGLLPTVDVRGGYTYTNSTADLEFATGQPAMNDLSAESNAYNASVEMNYVIFNGFGSTYQYRLLQEKNEAVQIQHQLTIESTLLQVTNVFLEICRQQEQQKIALEMLNISQDRLDRLKNAQEYGVTNQIDVLNAQVDYNNDKSNLINIELALGQAKRNLNQLINMDWGIDYIVDTNMILDGDLKYETLRSSVLSNNNNLLLAQSNITQQEFQEKIQRSFYLPRVNVSTNYGYSFSESNASLILSNQNLGLTGSVGLAWNLFDGNKRKTAIQNASLVLKSNELALEQSKLIVNKDFENNFARYQTQLQLIQLETQNVKVAELNFQKSKALFDQGQLTSIQFREAQINLINVKNKLNNTTFACKMTAIELKRLAGELMTKQ